MVEGTIPGVSTSRIPKIRIEPESEARFIALRLAKAGYYGGDPDKILKAPIGIVLDIIHYENFDADFNVACQAMNKEPT